MQVTKEEILIIPRNIPSVRIGQKSLPNIPIYTRPEGTDEEYRESLYIPRPWVEGEKIKILLA